jgi:protein-disulfide isomerase
MIMPRKPLIITLSVCLYLIGISYSYAQSAKDPRSKTDTKEKLFQDETIAVIDGRKISKSEIDAPMASQIQSLEQKIYELRSKSLEALINRNLLEEEAKRRGVSIEELRRQFIAGVKVEEKEVEEAYSGILSRYGPPPVTELEAKERLRATLESQKRSEAIGKAINELRIRSKIELYLNAPEPVKLMISTSGPSLGAKDAPITITVFSDFQCPYCKKINDTLKQVVQIYGSDVRVLYKNLPLPNHPQAFKAAQAAFCADNQGKFWQYHDLLFEHSSDLSENALKGYAAEIGLDLGGFGSCLGSESSKGAVMKDLQEARQAGIFSTPTFVINGRVLKGARNLEDFKVVIDQALKERQAQKAALIK